MHGSNEWKGHGSSRENDALSYQGLHRRQALFRHEARAWGNYRSVIKHARIGCAVSGAGKKSGRRRTSKIRYLMLHPLILLKHSSAIWLSVERVVP